MKLTLFLILINILMFFYSLTNFDYITTNYGFSMNNFMSGNYHVLITSTFLHADFLHLLSNMVALLFLGAAVESKVKKRQYLLVYFFAGVVGNLMMPLFYSEDVIAVGASAAISGLIGLGTFVCPGKLTMFPVVIPVPFVLAGAIYFLTTTSVLFAESDIAYPAHLGGMIVGAVFGLAWGENRIKRMMIFIFILALIIALPYILPTVIEMIK